MLHLQSWHQQVEPSVRKIASYATGQSASIARQQQGLHECLDNLKKVHAAEQANYSSREASHDIHNAFLLRRGFAMRGRCASVVDLVTTLSDACRGTTVMKVRSTTISAYSDQPSCSAASEPSPTGSVSSPPKVATSLLPLEISIRVFTQALLQRDIASSTKY